MIGTVSEEALLFIFKADPNKPINDVEYIAAITYLFTSNFAKVLWNTLQLLLSVIKDLLWVFWAPIIFSLAQIGK